jgi:hypothetical protein
MFGRQGLSAASAEPKQAASAAGGEAADLATLLLRALTDMAVRSKRRQADLNAVLHSAGLNAEPAQVRAALRTLTARGMIENLVPLSDGGLILSVTNAALDRRVPDPLWGPEEDPHKNV